MVKLKNIVIDKDLAKCDIFPEDSLKNGHVEVDLIKNKIISSSLPEGYEWCTNHVQHAATALCKLSQSEDTLPKEKLVMWY